MERLTEKGMCYFWFDFEDDGIGAVMNKLRKLEDLEEEIGMPLDVLVKLIMNKYKILYVLYERKIYTCDCISFMHGFISCFVLNNNYKNFSFSLNIFNEKWFLTREEAEKKLEEMKNEIL